MHVKNYLVFLAITAASGAMADARFETDTQQTGGLYTLQYAQVSIEDLSDSDLRRLMFYSERALGKLQDIVGDGSERSIVEQDKVNARFREAIARLADAGARSGLSMDQTADFFTQVVFDNFGQDFMQQVGAIAGGLDFRTLFRNVSTVPDPRTSNFDSGANFLNALADLGSEMAQGADGEGGTSEPTPPPPEGPVPLPNANPIERGIVERVQVVDGEWRLTVRAGDSLSTIASALYGNALAYTVIYGANTDVIRNPNVIDVGTVLVLPKP